MAGFTVSVGVATSPIDATDSQNLIAKADAALFKSKNEGKNIVTPYSDDRREFVRFDSRLIGEVRVMEPEGNPITTGNISQRGLLFTSGTPCQVGGVVEIQLTLPEEGEEEEVVCTAKVVRVIEQGARLRGGGQDHQYRGHRPPSIPETSRRPESRLGGL